MIKSFTVNKEARRLAKKLLAEARENESQITTDLQAIAAEVSAEMVGLENKFKAEMSLIRKLVDASEVNPQTIQEFAETLNDALRYTFVLPLEIYARGFRQTMEMLTESGCQVPKNRIWNAWETAGKRFDKGYRGINITVISSRNQIFELQFHTAESFSLKNETHFLYEEVRERNTSRKRKVEIIEILKRLAKNIKCPEGV